MSYGQQYPGGEQPPQGGDPGQGAPPPGGTPPGGLDGREDRDRQGGGEYQGGQSPPGGAPGAPDVPDAQERPQQWAQEPPQGGYVGQHAAGGGQAPPAYGQQAYGAPQGYGGYGPPPVPGAGTVPGDTDVVGRRVVQYIIDGILSTVIPLVALLVLLPLAFTPTEPDGSPSNPGLAAFLVLLVAVLWVLIYLGYWVLWPAKAGGQTLGMKMLGLRVVSADGTEASMMQHFLRWILLIVDGIFYGLVGLIVILASEGNQRLGDMVAKAYVVRA
ncbi:RDD family protein [Nocardiopsis baichengensis]|uniref:RDD family protein n=1 Tax=Nocardiopsis baichengensis TaxID=280240 RepID=UPI001EF9F2F3|nr:RDD family protein [Nocardiopsis baichengensis]